MDTTWPHREHGLCEDALAYSAQYGRSHGHNFERISDAYGGVLLTPELPPLIAAVRHYG